MQQREDGYGRASDDISRHRLNIVEAMTIPDTLPGAQGLGYSVIDDDVRSLVCGDLSIMLAFPMTIRGREASGAEFQEQCVVDRLGTLGVCTYLQRQVDLGARLILLIQLSIDPSSRNTTPWIAARAAVNNVTQQPDGTWHTALAFTRQRFIYGS